MTSIPVAEEVTSAASAASTWENPPRRSGMLKSVPFKSVGPEITAECKKLRCPKRHGTEPKHSRCSWMEAPMRTKASVKPKRFSYTVSWTMETPWAWLSATAKGCCQSGMNPGCTSGAKIGRAHVGTQVTFRSRMPSSPPRAPPAPMSARFPYTTLFRSYGAQAFAMQLDGGTHADQSVGKTKAVLIHGFVDDGDTVGLAQCHGQGLLPVGHESGVHIGFQYQRVEVLAAAPEANTVVINLKFATDFTVDVQERGQVPLGCAFDKNITVGYQCSGRPRSGLIAVVE